LQSAIDQLTLAASDQVVDVVFHALAGSGDFHLGVTHLGQRLQVQNAASCSDLRRLDGEVSNSQLVNGGESCSLRDLVGVRHDQFVDLRYSPFVVKMTLFRGTKPLILSECF